MATTKSYRIRVHHVGTTTPSDATVDFTLGLSEMVEPPELAGPLIFPAEGRTEAQAWSFPVIDRAGIVSSHLSDPATGRMWLLGRLVEVQDATDGGAWTTIGTGRLSDLSETGEAGLYTLGVEDERWVERNAEIFTVGGTAQVWPSGLKSAWRGFGFYSLWSPVAPLAAPISAYQGSLFGNSQWKAVQVDRRYVGSLEVANPTYDFSDTVRSWIQQDMELDFDPAFPTDSADLLKQRKLRLHISGADYEVIRFGDFSSDAPASPADPSVFDQTFVWIWLRDPGGVLTSAVVGQTTYLHAPGAEPSEDNPLHVGMDYTTAEGVNWGTPSGYIHPFLLARRIYDHIGERYDPVVMQALIDDTSYPPIAPRITAKASAAQWLEDHVYKANQVVAFTDAQGRVAPKSVRLPTDVDPNQLFVFNATTTALDERPTFEHTSRDVVNTLSVPGLQVRAAVKRGTKPDTDWPCDGLLAHELERVVGTDDGVSESRFGVRTEEYPLQGLKHPSEFRSDSEAQAQASALYSDVLRQLKREVFDAYQDGPIRGTIGGMRAADSVQPGDLVVLDHDSLKGPNPGANARSGQRIVRILRKTVRVQGPRFEFLDVGPALQPLAAPIVDIRAHPTDATKLQVEISSVPAGAVATLQVGFGATNPPVWSLTWTDLGATVIEIAYPPSATTAWARAQASAPGRIRSIWATDSVATAAVPRLSFADLDIDQDGVATGSWGANAATLGMRLYYALHAEGEEPTLSTFEDASAAAGSDAIPGTVAAGQAITVEYEPWTGWTGSAVSGIAGKRERRMAVRAAAITYRLVTDAAAIRRSAAGAYTPASLAISAQATTAGGTLADYAGRFVVAVSTDGTSYSDLYTSPADEAATTFAPPAGAKTIRVRLYLAGGTSTLADERIIPVVDDGAAGSSDPIAVITPTVATSTAVTLQYDGLPGSSGNNSLQWRRNLQAGAANAWSAWAAYNPASPPTETINRPGHWSKQVQLEIKDGLGSVGHASYWVQGNGAGVIQPPTDASDAGGGWIPNTAPIGSLGGSQAGDVVIDAQAGATADTDLTGMDTGGWISRSLRKVLAINRSGTQVVGGDLFQRGVSTLDDALDSPNFRKIGALFSDASNRLVNVFRGGAAESVNNLFKKSVDSLDAVADSATYVRTTPTEKTGAGYGYTGLDSAGYAKVGVRESASIAGLKAQLIARQGHGVFLETWDGGPPTPSTWFLHYGTMPTTLAAVGEAGGMALRATTQGWIAANVLIPYDSTKLYRMRVRVRQSGGAEAGSFYAGFEGVAADGLTLVNSNGSNTTGSQHYFVASIATVPAGTAYNTYTGYMRGLGTGADTAAHPDPTAPGLLYPTAKYVRPLLLFNYPTGDATYDIDEIAIDVLDEEGTDRTYTAIEAGGARLAPIPWRRGAGGVDMLPTEPFRLGIENLANVSDAPGQFRRISDAYTDPSWRPVNVYRGGVTEAVANLFKIASNTLDQIAEGTTYRRLASAFTDVSNRLVSIFRSGVTESAANLFKRGSDTLADVMDAPGQYRRVSDAYIDTSYRPVNVYRAGAVESVSNLFKKLVDTLDSVAEGVTYKRTTATEKTGAGRAAVALDTNNRLTDQRRLNQVVSANIACLQRNLTITATWDPTAGVDGSWKITVSAHTVVYGFGSVSYNQGIAWSAPNSTAYLYYNDPDFAGGSLSLVATGAPQNLIGDGRYRVGEIVLPAEGATPSPGTLGGSGAHPIVGA